MATSQTAEQREKKRAACRRWYQRNVESERLRSRIKGAKLFTENREVVLKRNSDWRTANLEKFRAKDRRYHAANRDRRNAAAKQYHSKHRNDPVAKLAHSIRSRSNYQKNKDRIQAQHQQWMLNHPGIQRVYSQHRRALEKSAAINKAKIREWMLSVKSKAFAACYYCHAVVSTKAIHFEHIVPLSRGGPHSIENMCVSCKPCNLNKGTRHISEWDKRGQQMLAL